MRRWEPEAGTGHDPAPGRVGRHRPTLGAVLLVLLAAGAQPDRVTADEAPLGPTAYELNTIRVIGKVAPAVVSILTVEPMGTGARRGLGSGFVIDKEGLIVTNAHLVDDAESIRVLLASGLLAPARLLGQDRQTDVALLKVDLPAQDLPVAELGDSDTIQVGQTVVALGNPFGLGQTASRGIVTARNRALPLDRYQFIDQVIQTDAAVNPGNSGGPLVDSRGAVIAMNTAVIREADNIAFAVPINIVRTVTAALRERGKVQRPWLGVAGQVVPPPLIALLRVPLARGFLVETVDRDSPAARAGLRAGRVSVQVEGQRFVVGGDVITEINGQPVETPAQYARVLQPLRPGDTVTLTLLRNGAQESVTVVLGERP